MKPELRQAMTSFNSEPLTVNGGQSERCFNPFCNAPMTARSGKTYCSDRCRTDGYVLRRAKAMIKQVGVITFFDRVSKCG
jgi:hypothetical protein